MLVTPQVGDELTPRIQTGFPFLAIIAFVFSSRPSRRFGNSGVLSRSRNVPGFLSGPRYTVSGHGKGTISIPNFLHRFIACLNSSRSEDFVIPFARSAGLRMQGLQRTYIDTLCARTDDQ